MALEQAPGQQEDQPTEIVHLRLRVLLPLPVKAYDFRPPHGFFGQAFARRVLVPWQGGTRVGVVIGVVEDLDSLQALREAIAVLDDAPLFSLEGLETLEQVSKQTVSPSGLVLADALPFGLEPALLHRVRLVQGVDPNTLPTSAHTLRKSSDSAWSDALEHDPALLDFLREQGLLEEEVSLEQSTRRVLQPSKALDAPDELKPALSPKQRQVAATLVRLGRIETLSALAREAGVSPSVATALMRRGLIEEIEEAIPINIEQAGTPFEEQIEEQIEERSGQLRASLWQNRLRIHGGSPKERLGALAAALRRAKGGVLYLAPDRLTLERAWQALGGLRPSALLHMDVSPREREAIWRGLAEGSLEVVFGTSMALFAPVRDLALIIVEEEGSDAHKLPGGARLFTPDVAAVRAKCAAAQLIFTGATPAVESLDLPGIVLAPPKVELSIIDYSSNPKTPEIGPLANLPERRNDWPLSVELKRALKEVLEQDGQAVLIAPRRGYSALLRCPDCGWIPFCAHCDVPMRWHAEYSRLECHQCGHTDRPPHACPRCAGTVLAPRGPGSEWIAREVARLLRRDVYRYDRDRRDDLSSLERGEPGIVVGTVALLSRPAPPKLTLSALTFADSLFTRPDFRAAERYHALLRRLIEWPQEPVRLIVQTFAPRHPALQAVQTGLDSAQYPASELKARAELGYPPFRQLAMVGVASKRPSDAERAAQALKTLLIDRGAELNELLGPAPAPIARVKGLHSWQLLVRAHDQARLTALLEGLGRHLAGARLRVEFNPRDLATTLD